VVWQSQRNATVFQTGTFAVHNHEKSVEEKLDTVAAEEDIDKDAKRLVSVMM